MRLAIVIPCYNEQEILPHTLEVLTDLLDKMCADSLVTPDSFILCCNDGSTDATMDIIRAAHARDNRIKGLSLAHNRGTQNVLMAGLMTVLPMADITVTLDADLQDAPEAIPEMVRKHRDGGADIVYGVRSSRKTDPWFKRASARGFYRFQNFLGLETVYDHADFRLMDRKALLLLSEYGERNLFLRGIIPQLGLNTATVTYDRAPRRAGLSKYPVSRMLSLSIDGITSFTARPMRLIFLVGLGLLLIDIIVAIWVLVAHFGGRTISGWSSLMLSVWFLGSLILIGIGIVGEYIGKIFIEVKQRPRYAVTEELLD